jgi:hypothetical protein
LSLRRTSSSNESRTIPGFGCLVVADLGEHAGPGRIAEADEAALSPASASITVNSAKPSTVSLMRRLATSFPSASTMSSNSREEGNRANPRRLRPVM